ncbi:MAG: ABC transporter substrate-binding protein [Rubritepida sp.]|jgi:branched-chain amino acid transport system substrate-binding protein|nr:ABC transporter substrate-binding protein [Rubritepida sp.]
MRRRHILASMPLLAAPSLARAQASELRIGAVFPLSGAAALLGDEAARGLEMAVEARNNGGAARPLRLIRADATEAAAALAEARRLVQQERVTLLFGSVSAAIGLAVQQGAEALETPFVELAAAADALIERGARLALRTAPSAGAYGRLGATALTQFLPNHLGLPLEALRVALLHENGLSPESLAAALAARLDEAGVTVAERLSHAPRSGEWPATVQRLRAAGINVVVHAAMEADALAMLRALADAGWRPRAVIGAGPAWGLSEMARALGPVLEGVFALDVPPIECSPAWALGARRFAEAYQRRWGSAPRSGLSLAAYTGARVVLGQGTLERGPLRAALNALDQPGGALPNGWGWRLDERGQNTRAAPVLLQWQAGRPVAVFPQAAAAAAPV